MRTNRMLLAVLLLLLAVSAACTGQPAAMATPLASQPTSSTFTDPFEYCRAVGTMDTVDARYIGTPVPDAIINGYKVAAGLQASTEPADMFKKSTIWRCMGGKVFACNFGANLPCDSKANTDKAPTQAMNEFCAANPTSEFIPMAVTGHNTIYSWRCAQGVAQVGEQVAQVDEQGYIKNIWYAIEP